MSDSRRLRKASTCRRTAGAKRAVQAFWEEAACGEIYLKGKAASEAFEAHRARRYELEPFILRFAKFDEAAGLRVLEIGVAEARPERLVGGMSADHVNLDAASSHSHAPTRGS